MTTAISFVALTWNSEGYIRRFLDSVLQQCSTEQLAAEVIVVDNGSRDSSPAVLGEYRERHPAHIKVIGLPQNRGTTYSRNLAFRACRGAVVGVIDSDTEFLSGALRPVMELLAAHPEVGIVAPRLVLADGRVQHSVKRFPTLVDKLAKVPRILAGRPATQGDFYERFPFESCTLVETAISACWFFRRDLLVSVGLLDEGIFYAPEDVDYSARVRAAGRLIVYYPHLTLLHHTQQITHRRPLSPTSLSHLRGLLRLHRKHGGWLARRPFEPVAWPAGDEAASISPGARQ